ncbi:MAG: transcriptional regulator [Actinobacteria bacterium]|nr:transcriptional regulator [Actinomycetota bacterium]
MRLLRIGDKIIDRDRLVNIISEILHRRTIGATQQEVAVAMGLERAFVSHLEGLGEVRRGNRIAVIGFPIANKEELESIAQTFAVDFIYLLSEKERKEHVRRRSGAEMFNELLELLASLKDYDAVVFLASDKRIATLEKILDKEVIGIPLGNSPIKRDRKVKPGILYDVLESVTEGKELSIEESGKRKFRFFKKKPSGKG